ncbi:MAG: 3-keto-disaccharide hydrolase [Candidatus Zipacnadales bacterium]
MKGCWIGTLSICLSPICVLGPTSSQEALSSPTRERVEFVLLRHDGESLGREVKAHLYNDGREVGESVLSNEAGIIAYEDLPCGRYDLWIEGLPAPLFRGLEVILGEGTQTIELKVPKAGTVTGKLLLPDDKTPASGYIIAVESGTVPELGTAPTSWAAAYAVGALACYAQAEVSTDGTFTLDGLTPGIHSLDIRLPAEREPINTLYEVKVAAGQTTDLGTVRLPSNRWEHLWDHRTLEGWMESDFYGKNEVRIENGYLIMTMGNDMTGITYTKPVHRLDYEVSLQAMRVEGSDFFCGLTFPVDESYCSLILGGWGGSVVGLSSLDGYDASENETTQWIQFKERTWYRVRVRVTKTRIQAWLDDRRIVNVSIEGRRVSTRIEVEESKPFGIATWRTTGAVRDIRLRRLDAGEE